MTAGTHRDSAGATWARRCRHAVMAIVTGMLMLCLGALAGAQEPSDQTAIPQPDPMPTEASPAPAAAPPSVAPAALPTPPEVIGAIGRFIDRSITNVGTGVGSGVKGMGESLGATTNAAGEIAKGVTDAAGTVVRLPATNVVSGKERCMLAANGSPDCEAATVMLCKTKGFERGRALDIQSSRKCPAYVYLQGKSDDSTCANESVVARAICQ
jgi:hypothetical protein